MPNLFKRMSDLNAPVHIPVEYTNLMPSCLPFMKNQSNELITKPKSLIHTSLVEKAREPSNNIDKYMSVFFNDMAKDFYVKNNYLFLKDDIKNDSENIGKFSELWGCACAIEVQLQMSNISLKDISKVVEQGKRLDYKAIVDNKIIGIEAKGRSKKYYFDNAIKDIEKKKNSKKNSFKAMFGFVTLTSRDNELVRVTVVDPPDRIFEADRRDKIISMLEHYSFVSRLSGFTLLSTKLEDRISSIIEIPEELSEFDKNEIDYKNAKKMGSSYMYIVGDKVNFIDHRFNNRLGKNRFGISKELYELLHEQDFSKLLDYEADISLSEIPNVSVHRDGTIMVFENENLR